MDTIGFTPKKRPGFPTKTEPPENHHKSNNPNPNNPWEKPMGGIFVGPVLQIDIDGHVSGRQQPRVRRHGIDP